MDTLFPSGLYTAIDLDVQRSTGKDIEFYNSMPHPCVDFSLSEWQAYSLVRSIKKKFLPRDTTEQDALALLKFRTCNKQCGEWEARENTSLDEELLGTVKSVLDDFFYPRGMPLLDWDNIFLKGRCGPGSGIGSDGNDFYSKMFSSLLTCTSSFLVEHYERNVVRWPDWQTAEKSRSEHFGPPVIVNGSKLSFVPKNDRISRSICTEPLLNMFYQLGCGEILERRLKSRFGIDLSIQPLVNQELAASGSEGAPWSTIDLESASDTISLRMCEYLLPREVLSYFKIMRSCVTSHKGSTFTLDMISTMGNGFTFPLQTIIFCAVVEACYMSLSLPVLKGQTVNFGVFGDDIVIDQVAWPRVLRVLALLGFSVNQAKSFNQGPFRESCGRDYVNGHNIRGVYPRRLRQPQDFYALINALNDFTARTGFPLPSAVRWLLKRVDRSMEIPAWEDPSGGIRMPLALVRSRRAYKRYQSVLYDRLEPQKRTIRIMDDYIYADQYGRRRLYNPSGLLITALSGVALSSGLPCRLATDRLPWRRKRLSCSSWDRLQLDSTLNGGFDWRQWETAVYSNLIWVKPGR